MTQTRARRPASGRRSRGGLKLVGLCLGLSSVLLTACGSTVQLSGQEASSVAARVPAGDGLSGPAVGSVDGLGGSPAGAGPASSGEGATGAVGPGAGPAGTGTAAGTQGGASGVATGAAPGAAAPPAASTPGQALEPKIFKIGLQYSDNGGAALKSTTGGSFSADGRDAARAVLAWINKNGGIAGRKAEPAFANADATASPTAIAQEACAQWTQDDKVALAVPTIAVQDTDLMRTCLGRAKTPAFMGYVASKTAASALREAPLWFEAGTLSLESYSRTTVQALKDQGLFGADAKVGVVYFDRKPFSTVLQSTLLPALRAAGLKDVVTFGASIDGAQTLASGGNEMSSAVLNFRSAGVNRVIFFEPWLGYFTFMNNAESQNYRPTYGLTSQQGPQLAMDLGFVPPAQLVGAKIVSWNPMTDTRDYTRYLGPRLATCTNIYKEAGVVRGADQTAYWQQLLTCENLLLIQEAYRTAPARLAPDAFGAGLRAIGNKAAFATRTAGSFSATKQTSIAQYWHGAYDSARKTFVLSGAARPIVP